MRVIQDKVLLRIFISHSHKDNDFGLQLVRDLRKAIGNDDAVWYDMSGGLHGGDAWWRKIVTEVTTRSIFIVVLSPDSMSSDWVNDEIDLAWQQKNSSLGKIIIPLMYRACDVRADLNTRQIITFLPPRDYKDAFTQLLLALGISEAYAQDGPLTNSSVPIFQLGDVDTTITTTAERINNEVDISTIPILSESHLGSIDEEIKHSENVPRIKKRFPITSIFTSPSYVPPQIKTATDKPIRIKKSHQSVNKTSINNTKKLTRSPLLLGIVLLLAAFILIFARSWQNTMLESAAGTKTASSKFATLTAATVKGTAIAYVATVTANQNGEYKDVTPDCNENYLNGSPWYDNSYSLRENNTIQCLPGNSTKLSYGGGECTYSDNQTFTCVSPKIYYHGFKSLPLSFSTSIEVDNLSNQGCVDFDASQVDNSAYNNTNTINYDFSLCQTGSWNFGVSSNTTGVTNYPQTSGSIKLAAMYSINLTVSSGHKIIVLNGSKITDIAFSTPSFVTKTDTIAIGIDNYAIKQGQVITANVKNFDFLPSA